MTGWVGATRPSLNGGGRGCSRGNTGRWVYSRSLQSDILARCRCHHGDCSAFRSLELGKCHWPLQAALSGSLIKAPGFAGGYLLVHATHTAHATARHSGGTTFLLRPFGDHGFRGDQKPV